MRLGIKIGGAQLEDASARDALAVAVAAAVADGHRVVIVHGGGNQIRALGRRLGLGERYHDGLRVTDAATAELVVQVLAGQVNKDLVTALNARQVRAVGLCGVDGDVFSARRLAADGVDLGFVGAVHRVDARLPELLLAQGYTPVIATVAALDAAEHGPRERLYNVNADHAIAPLAAAMHCDAVLFLTDVPAVRGAEGEALAELDPRRCAALRAERIVHGGMIPKLDAALTALASSPRAIVKIAPAAGDDAVRNALRDGVGTRFVPDPA